MIYVLLALLVYVLFQVPRIMRDLPYQQYNPKTAATLKRDNDVINLAVRMFALMLLVLFAGLRGYNVGLDTYQFYYPNYLTLMERGGWYLNYEKLYSLLEVIGYFLFRSYGFTFVLTACAAIIVFCVYAAAKKMSPNVGLLMFLMVCCVIYTRGFSTMRQCVAIALGVLGTAYATEKKWWRYLLLVVLAYGFHRLTALMFLPVLALIWIKNDWHQLVLWGEIALAAVIFLCFDAKIIKILCNIIGNDRYYVYYVYDDVGVGKPNLIHWADLILTVAGFVGFYLFKLWYRWRHHQPVSPTYDLLLNIYFVAVVALVVAIVSGRCPLYERLALPFTWAGIFLTTQIVAKLPQPRVKLLAQIGVMVGASLYLLLLVYFGNHMILPYNLIG